VTDSVERARRSNGTRPPLELQRQCPDDGCEGLFVALHRRIDELSAEQSERAKTVDLAFGGVTARLEALSRRTKRQTWLLPVVLALIALAGQLGSSLLGRPSKTETVDAVRAAIAAERMGQK